MVEGKNTMRSAVRAFGSALKSNWYLLAVLAFMVVEIIDGHNKPVVMRSHAPWWFTAILVTGGVCGLVMLVMGWFRLREWGRRIEGLTKIAGTAGSGGTWVRTDELASSLREWAEKPLLDASDGAVDARAANRAWAKMLRDLATHVEGLPSRDNGNDGISTTSVVMKMNTADAARKAN